MVWKSLEFENLEETLSGNAKSVMDTIRNKHKAAPKEAELVHQTTRSIEPKEIGKAVVAEMKGATPEEQMSILMDAAQSLPKDVFNAVLHLRKSSHNNLIAWKHVNNLFNKIAGTNEKITGHLSMGTKADAIWEAANNGKPVDAHTLFAEAEPVDSVRVFDGTTDVDTGVAPDRYVTIDEMEGEISGTLFSLSKAAPEILQRMKNRGGSVLIKMSDTAGDSVQEVPVSELKQHLDDLREESGVAHFEKVLEGEEPIVQKVKQKTQEQHFNTIQKKWNELKKMYGTSDRQQIAHQADDLVAAAKSPEDMDEIIDGLSEYAKDNTEMRKLLDEAKDTTKDLVARREALKKASFCILGK